MKKHIVAQRILQVMNEKGLRQVDVLRLCEPHCDRYGVKLGKNDLSQYVSGKVTPGQVKLTILSKALNVSEAWLLGYDEAPGISGLQDTNNGNEQADEYMNLYRKLSDNQKNIIINLMKELIRE